MGRQDFWSLIRQASKIETEKQEEKKREDASLRDDLDFSLLDSGVQGAEKELILNWQIQLKRLPQFAKILQIIKVKKN